MPDPEAGTVEMAGRTIPYAVVRSARARNIRLRIGPHPRVDIIVPRGRRLPDVAELVRDKQSWIVKHLDRLENQPAPPPLQNGSLLPYLDGSLVLEILPSLSTRARAGMRSPENGQSQGRIRLLLPAGWDPRGVLEAWYRAEAREVLSERLRFWSRHTGLAHGRMTVRDQRTRWGSCSSEGNLSFNWRLVLCPPAVLDYVVLHELLHTVEPNHSPAFWRRVGQHDPEYQQHRLWLRHNETRLGQLFRE